MCLRIAEDNAEAAGISNTFSFGLDILYAEVCIIILLCIIIHFELFSQGFIHYLMDSQSLNYEDATKLYYST